MGTIADFVDAIGKKPEEFFVGLSFIYGCDRLVDRDSKIEQSSIIGDGVYWCRIDNRTCFRFCQLSKFIGTQTARVDPHVVQ